MTQPELTMRDLAKAGEKDISAFLKHIEKVKSNNQTLLNDVDKSVGVRRSARLPNTRSQIERKIESVTTNAGGWVTDAVVEIAKIAQRNVGVKVLAEEIRAKVIPIIGDAPNDPRAWGGVLRIAAKCGYVQSTGEFKAAKTSNGSGKAVWKMLGSTVE